MKKYTKRLSQHFTVYILHRFNYSPIAFIYVLQKLCFRVRFRYIYIYIYLILKSKFDFTSANNARVVVCIIPYSTMVGNDYM